jgi:hypothetical protein
LVSRFCTFCYERCKASRTKQFGMRTHRIYTGNSGGGRHSVEIIYPNYMQYTQTWDSKFCRHPVSTQLVVPTVTDTYARWHWTQEAECRYDSVWKYCTYASVGILASSFADEKSPTRSITAHFILQKLLKLMRWTVSETVIFQCPSFKSYQASCKNGSVEGLSSEVTKKGF